MKGICLSKSIQRDLFQKHSQSRSPSPHRAITFSSLPFWFSHWDIVYKIKQTTVSRRIYFCYEWNKLRTTSDSAKLTTTAWGLQGSVSVTTKKTPATVECCSALKSTVFHLRTHDDIREKKTCGSNKSAKHWYHKMFRGCKKAPSKLKKLEIFSSQILYVVIWLQIVQLKWCRLNCSQLESVKHTFSYSNLIVLWHYTLVIMISARQNVYAR